MSGQGISMYLFPKDPKLRKIWVVKMKREGFVPSNYSKLCERHFEKDQFSVNPDIAAIVGFQPKAKMLITGAVPAIFDYTYPKAPQSKLGKKGKRPADTERLPPLQQVQLVGNLYSFGKEKT